MGWITCIHGCYLICNLHESSTTNKTRNGKYCVPGCIQYEKLAVAKSPMAICFEASLNGYTLPYMYSTRTSKKIEQTNSSYMTFCYCWLWPWFTSHHHKWIFPNLNTCSFSLWCIVGTVLHLLCFIFVFIPPLYRLYSMPRNVQH